MNFPMDQNSSYRVEVSGWDSKESFFVEKTILDWGQEDKKEINLRTSLRQGCIVFVRLLQPNADNNNFPVAYQAVLIAPRDGNGRARVILKQLRPRAAEKESLGSAGETTVRVA